jgi:hypothetical protein
MVLAASPDPSSTAPAFRGFPVYPPEAVERIVPTEVETATGAPRMLHFTTSLRHLAVALKDPRSQANGLASVSKEWDEAQAYLKANASSLGWKEITSFPLSDGGSEDQVYARVGDGKIDVIHLNLGLRDGAHIEKDGIRMHVGWGTIDYRYQPIPTSVVYREFPLIGATALPVARTIDGSEQLEFESSLRSVGYQFLFPLLGWERVPGDCHAVSEEAYGRGGQVVLIQTDRRPTRVTFLPSEKGRACLGKHPVHATPATPAQSGR